jgi:hypothetical protein
MATSPLPSRDVMETGHGETVMIVGWVLLFASTIVVGLRLYTRISRVHSVKLDDYLMIVAWVSYGAPLNVGYSLTIPQPSSSSSCTWSSLVSPSFTASDSISWNCRLQTSRPRYSIKLDS